MSLDPRSALAAKTFPKAWARVATATGRSASKARNNLRKAAEHKVVLDELKARGESCDTCSAFERKGPCGPHCLRDTDFHGYAIRKPTDLCHRWEAK